MPPPIVPIVVALHAEEAALLWLRRDLAVAAPHYQLQDLADLDGRLAAHLDGLRIAGDAGWAICLEELKSEEPEELFPAAVLAFQRGDRERIETVLTHSDGKSARARAVVSALGWLSSSQAPAHIDNLLQASAPFKRRMGIAAAVAHRLDPGAELECALRDADVPLRARALRAIGELGRRDLLPAANDGLRSDDSRVRFWSAWTLARLSDQRCAVEVLRRSVESQSVDDRLALPLVLGRIDAVEASAWLKRLACDGRTARTAAIGGGIAGRPEAIEWLLEMVGTAALARVAGEAFSMITGADLATEKLEGSPPAGFAAGPTEDPANDDVAMDADENQAWPDAAKVAAWWQRRRGEFVPGARCLCGRTMNEPWLEQVLRCGYQRQRAVAAVELSLARPDQPLFNVRAMALRQQQWLG